MNAIFFTFRKYGMRRTVGYINVTEAVAKTTFRKEYGRCKILFTYNTTENK